MALWHCGVYGAAHPVLRVSAVRERVRGVRFVVLCPRFVWQTVLSTSALVSLHALAISTFAAEKSPSRSACGRITLRALLAAAPRYRRGTGYARNAMASTTAAPKSNRDGLAALDEALQAGAATLQRLEEQGE